MKRLLYDYTLDELLEIPLLIKEASIRYTKDQKPYIALTLQDSSGQMDAKLWNASQEQLQTLVSGKVVVVKGVRELYNNTQQLKILRIVLSDNYRVSDFLERVPMEKEAIEEAINLALFSITDAHLARVTRHIYQKYKETFYEFPAAKRHHHAVVGGLSYHTLTMLKIADALIEIYPEINRSLLTAGILLHDIGKVIELSGVIGTEYTLSGKLIGHIVLMSDEITKACSQLTLDDQHESILLLKHLVLAHHGQLDYGSPVAPILLEAELIHHIDMIDARMNMMTSALERVEPGQFSEKIYGLENRMLYRPKL